MNQEEKEIFDDLTKQIDLLISHSEERSFDIPEDKDLCLTTIELFNFRSVNSGENVILSISTEVCYFRPKSEEEILNTQSELEPNSEKSDSKVLKIFQNSVIEKGIETMDLTITVSKSLTVTTENIAITQMNLSRVPTFITSTSSADNSDSENGNFSTSSVGDDQPKSIFIPVELKFCHEMKPVFHLQGDCDARLYGFYTELPQDESDPNEEEAMNS